MLFLLFSNPLTILPSSLCFSYLSFFFFSSLLPTFSPLSMLFLFPPPSLSLPSPLPTLPPIFILTSQLIPSSSPTSYSSSSSLSLLSSSRSLSLFSQISNSPRPPLPNNLLSLCPPFPSPPLPLQLFLFSFIVSTFSMQFLKFNSSCSFFLKNAKYLIFCLSISLSSFVWQRKT